MTDRLQEPSALSQWRCGSEKRCVSGELKNGYSSRSTSTPPNTVLHRTSRALSVRMQFKVPAAGTATAAGRSAVRRRSTAASGRRSRARPRMAGRYDVPVRRRHRRQAIAARAAQLLQERACVARRRCAIEHVRLGACELLFADDAAVTQRLQLFDLIGDAHAHSRAVGADRHERADELRHRLQPLRRQVLGHPALICGTPAGRRTAPCRHRPRWRRRR